MKSRVQQAEQTWELPIPDLTDQVRGVDRAVPRPVTVATALVGDVAFGVVAEAFASVSLAPPMTIFSIADSKSTSEGLANDDLIGISVLSSVQRDVAARFLYSPAQPLGEIPSVTGSTEIPLVEGASAHLELEIEKRMPAYGRTIVLARVVDARFTGLPPLVSLGGRLHDGARISQPPLSGTA